MREKWRDEVYNDDFTEEDGKGLVRGEAVATLAFTETVCVTEECDGDNFITYKAMILDDRGGLSEIATITECSSCAMTHAEVESLSDIVKRIIAIKKKLH